MFTKALITAAAMAVTAVLSSVPAGAQPGPPPREFALSFICNVIPMAPNLDDDVDLTEQLPPADPNAPPPESLPAADPCAAGCI